MLGLARSAAPPPPPHPPPVLFGPSNFLAVGAMNAKVLKKTQDTLGKVIKKPPLTEKLLCKPPFRYLHDIFCEVRT